jgi:hypothetical protein
MTLNFQVLDIAGSPVSDRGVLALCGVQLTERMADAADDVQVACTNKSMAKISAYRYRYSFPENLCRFTSHLYSNFGHDVAFKIEKLTLLVDMVTLVILKS